MKKKTISQHILSYLNDRDWTSSTHLDRQISEIAMCKEATVSRTARQLAEDNKLQKKMLSKVIWYKIGEEVRKKKQSVEIVNGVAHLTYN